jgi:hypothetical protein
LRTTDGKAELPDDALRRKLRMTGSLRLSFLTSVLSVVSALEYHPQRTQRSSLFIRRLPCYPGSYKRHYAKKDTHDEDAFSVGNNHHERKRDGPGHFGEFFQKAQV